MTPPVIPENRIPEPGRYRDPMVEFAYQEMLAVGPDDTPYRLLSADHVSTFEAGGRRFLQVDPEAGEIERTRRAVGVRLEASCIADAALSCEALRDDAHFAYVAVWEYAGEGKPPILNKEPLVFENVKLTQRSYK